MKAIVLLLSLLIAINCVSFVSGDIQYVSKDLVTTPVLTPPNNVLKDGNSLISTVSSPVVSDIVNKNSQTPLVPSALTDESVNSAVDVVSNDIATGDLVGSKTLNNGAVVDQRRPGPGLPPANYDPKSDLASDAEIAAADASGRTAAILAMAKVPAMTWSYGCSATSATMLFGYYDRNGKPNFYKGPTNSGVFPLKNAVWGTSTEGNGQCPLTASQKGLDGRTKRGSKDDYYKSYGSSVDPYYGNWAQHTKDSIADFMGTNMYRKYKNTDGSTTFYYYTDNKPLVDYTGGEPTSRDGGHGMKLFSISRGYGVKTVFNQYIYGYGGKSAGFTYAQYKAEINAGRPVLIQVDGHTMLGVGYYGTNGVYVRNTWDYSTHKMTWGGYYSGMKHYGVTVFRLN